MNNWLLKEHNNIHLMHTCDNDSMVSIQENNFTCNLVFYNNGMRQNSSLQPPSNLPQKCRSRKHNRQRGILTSPQKDTSMNKFLPCFFDTINEGTKMNKNKTKQVSLHLY